MSDETAFTGKNFRVRWGAIGGPQGVQYGQGAVVPESNFIAAGQKVSRLLEMGAVEVTDDPHTVSTAPIDSKIEVDSEKKAIKAFDEEAQRLRIELKEKATANLMLDVTATESQRQRDSLSAELGDKVAEISRLVKLSADRKVKIDQLTAEVAELEKENAALKADLEHATAPVGV